MNNDTTDSGLGEALASYQPSSMPASTWERFRGDAIELVLRLDLRDERDGRQCLSRLAVFLADLADVRPTASVSDLLTAEQVDGHLQRALDSGTAAGTVENRQGTLNALLRVRSGRRKHESRTSESHLEPYGQQEIAGVLAAAIEDGSVDALDLARSLVCGLAGRRLPTDRRPDPVRVEVDEGIVTVDEVRWEAPDGLPLPPAGQVDVRSVERGRRWAAANLDGFRLDVRRVELTRIARLVATRPAIEALRLDGVGRDRLTAAVAASPAPAAAELREMLRRPQPLDHEKCA